MVTVDLEKISFEITEYLLKLGHQSIGLITGEQGVMTSRRHLNGYSKALSIQQIPVDMNLVRLEAFTEKCGYNSCKEMLESQLKPTAICCGCDPIAVGVLHALHEANLKVPDDVSLISIGDTPMASHLRPALSSVSVPRYEMGAKAVELILSNNTEKSYIENLSCRFIERDSVKSLL